VEVTNFLPALNDYGLRITDYGLRIVDWRLQYDLYALARFIRVEPN